MKEIFKKLFYFSVLSAFSISVQSCGSSANTEITDESSCEEMRAECSRLFNSVKPQMAQMIQEEKAKNEGKATEEPGMENLPALLGSIAEIEQVEALTKKMEEKGCTEETEKFSGEVIVWMAAEYSK